MMKMMMMMTVLVMMMGVVRSAEDTCISSIVPCAPYLNATMKPPSACCDPLLNVINTDQQCLCNLLNSNVIKQFNLNITQALHIPALCGKNVTTDACTNNATKTTPPPSKTPTSPSGSSTDNNTDKSAAASIEILPVPVLAFLLVGLFELLS